MKQRPLAITVLSWMYIAVGVAMLVVHGRTALRTPHPEDAAILTVELLAIVAGVFMLRGANWARWLAVVWIAGHVAIASLNDRRAVLVHAIIFVGIAVLLFRAEAQAWFSHRPAQGS